MRAVLMSCGFAAVLALAPAALAQGLQVPPSSGRAEQQVNSINRSMRIDQQNRAAAQQNQFEVNSLRNEISRPAPPPLVPHGVAPGIR